MMAGGGPRRPHPPPSQPAVARVTPMVPEVSLFFPSQPKPGNGKSPHLWTQGDPHDRVPHGDFARTNPPINESSNPRPDPSKPSQLAFNHPSNTTRRALNNSSNLGPAYFHNSSNPAPRAFNNFNPSRKPLNLPSNPSPTPSAVNSPAPAPAPHRAPTPTQFKPQSDFSRMFAGVDMTCLVPGEQGSGGRQQEGVSGKGGFMVANGGADPGGTQQEGVSGKGGFILANGGADPGGTQQQSVSGKGGFMVANGGADNTQMFNVLEKMVGQGSEDRSEEDGGRWVNSSGELERGDSRNGWRERNQRQRSCNANEPQKQNIGNNDNVNIAMKSQYDLHQKQDHPRQEIVHPYQSQNEKQKILDNQFGNFNNVTNGSKNVQFTPIARNDVRNDTINVNQNLQFTPNPNGTDDGSKAMINRMPPQNLSNPNDIRTQSSMGTQSTPDLKSPPRTNLASQSQPNLVSQASPLPPDLIQVLSWQNDQLRQLQKQVEILLQSPARRLETPTITPTQTPAATCTASTMTSMVWPDLEAAMAKLAAATDTLEHPTAATDTLEHPTVEEMNNSSASTSPQPSLHLDLPDYTPSEVSPQTGGGRRGKAMVDIKDIDSPVLGESVSMYESSGEADNPQELYNNILGQVRRMLDVDGETLSPITERSTTTTESSTQQSSTQPSRSQPRLPATQLPPTTPTPPSPAVDPATATLERLRSLGISFISPADLTPATVQSAQDTGNKYNSVYLPTAAEPSISVFQGASPDTSLDINSLALKYLDDSQLTRLAEKHLGAENGEQVPVNKNRPEKEESGNNLSMATHQFLNRYGLGEQTNGLPSKTAKPRRNAYLDVIQETHTSHVTRDRQLLNQASVPQNQINHMQTSPQNHLLQQQSPHPPQHLSRQPQQQHSPRLQQVQPHQFQQLQREPQNQRFQHEHIHRFQQQSPNFQQHQSPPLLRQQTPPLLPQQVLQLQQRGSQQHSPRLRQQVPVHLQAGSNVNIPNRILDITAIRQQPKLL